MTANPRTRTQQRASAIRPQEADAPGNPATQRGTRPHNRRALIVAAASDLFARLGYDRTGMSDIAAAVGISPSALYRHFASKQELLAQAVIAGLEPFRQLIGSLHLTDHDDALGPLASMALDQRPLGVLWQREVRHLAPEDQHRTRELLRETAAALTEQVRAVHPALHDSAAGLVAWSMMAVLTTPSFHRLDLPRPTHDQLLARLLHAVLDTPLPPVAPARAPFEPVPATWPEPTLVPASRRETLLMHAMRLFAAHGYTSVGIEDIGAAAGITGPSVYNHVDSKLELLTVAFRRGTAVLFMDISKAYAGATSARDGLSRLTASYVDFALTQHHVVTLLITEIGHLAPTERDQALQAQRDYLEEWTHLLSQVRPDLDETTRRIRVRAAIDVINNAVRIPRLRQGPGIATALTTLCAAILGLGE